MFKKDMFENFTLVDIDLESLSFTFFINYTDLWNINQIYQFYLDIDSGELKFIKNASKIFRYVFCWFHVLNKNFIPILDKCKYGVDVIEKIIYLVR
jgi:hypothetical protein